MNNSVKMLARMLTASLRNDVLPHLADPFARGQLFAAIYILNNLERQASWSDASVAQQADAVERAIAELEQAAGALDLVPPARAQPSAAGAEQTEEARRDAANAHVCALLDWLADRHDGAQAAAIRDLEARLLAHARAAVEAERALIAPSMMNEMSQGGK